MDPIGGIASVESSQMMRPTGFPRAEASARVAGPGEANDMKPQ